MFADIIIGRFWIILSGYMAMSLDLGLWKLILKLWRENRAQASTSMPKFAKAMRLKLKDKMVIGMRIV